MRKWERFSVLLGVILAAAASAYAGEGGTSGGGGDNPPPEADSAWFLGTGTIHYCVDAAPNYPIALPDAQDEVAAALGKWKNYIEKKQANVSHSTSNPRPPLAIQTQLLPACTDSADLAIHLGVSTPSIDQIKKTYFYNPTAFSWRTSYDVRAGWGKGFVWVSDPTSFSFPPPNPTATARQRLQAILLHEIGHVYGNGHLSQTIMDADIIGWNYNYAPQNPQIDGAIELYSCEQCGLSGTLGDDPQAMFKKFAGRAAKGAIRASAKVSDGKITLKLKDSQPESVLPKISFNNQDPNSYSELDQFVPVFKRTTVTTDAPGDLQYSSMSRHVESVVAFGTIQDAGGKTYVLTVEMNMNTGMQRSPLTFHYLDQNRRVRLFTADAPSP